MTSNTQITDKNSLSQWLSWQETLYPKEIDLGLQRVNIVLRHLLPQYFLGQKQKLPFLVITVAGTNGKGSTIEYLHTILQQASYRVGVYTSPHLLQYNERIQINHQLITDQQLCDIFSIIDQARKDQLLSYFEFGTLAAILHFVQQKCDVVILEVGLGGRLDAVNCIDADCSLVTTVDLDHQDWLGDNIEKIAFEKAGIFRANKPAIYGDENIPLSLKDHANKINANLLQYAENYFYSKHENNNWSWEAKQSTKWKKIDNLAKPPIWGDIQYKNLTNAIMVLNSLADKLDKLDKDIISLGLRNAVIAGRLQHFDYQPQLILDVAHNSQAAVYLKDHLLKYPIKGKTYAIFSMLADKDVNSVLQIMDEVIDGWNIYPLNSNRALARDKMLLMMSSSLKKVTMGKASVTCYNCFSEAFLQQVEKMNNTEKNKNRVVIFGSFLIVADALRFLDGQ